MLFTHQFLVWHSLHGFLSNFCIPSTHHRLIVALALKAKFFTWFQALHGWPMYFVDFSNDALFIFLPHWISFCSKNIAHLPRPRMLFLSTPLNQLVYFLHILKSWALKSLLLDKFSWPLLLARSAPSPPLHLFSWFLIFMVMLYSYP